MRFIYFPIADSNTEIFPSGLVERLVRPMHKHSGPSDLLKIAWSKAWGAISITIASFGTWDIAS